MGGFASALRAAGGVMKTRWPYLAIIAAVFYVYFRTLYFGYTYFDDNALVLDNNWFLKNPANAGQAFLQEVFNTHAAAAYYRPFLTLSFMFDAHFGGIAPFMYHLTNMLLHTIASCLVFYFLSMFGVRRHPAFALSFLFAVHPVLAQAVAWIPGRNDSLLAIFALSAMITLLRYRQSGKLRYLFMHSLLFTCGLFTKESMVFFPALALLWLMKKNEKQVVSGKNIRFISIAATWLAPGVIWFLLRKTALSHNPIHYSQADTFTSLWHNLPAILLDIGKIFLPINLSVVPILQDSTALYGIIVLIAAAALLIFIFFRSRVSAAYKQTAPEPLVLLFGVSWFLVFLVPSFIRPNTSYPADFLEHRLYVPMAGLLLIIAQVKAVKNIDFHKFPSWIAAGTVAYVLSLITVQHITVFSDRVPFWENAVKNSPHHPLAHKNLGAMYYLDGKIDRAEQEYRTALELYPQETMVHNNLGLIYKSRGEYTKAQEEYKKELAVNPNYDNAYFNWGLLCYLAGNKKDAEILWLKTLEVNPDYIDATRNLCSYYRETGDTAKAYRLSLELEKRGATK